MSDIAQKIVWNTIFLLFPFSLLSQTLDNVITHTSFLASDKLEGRGAGSKGIQLAAEYIAEQFRTIGLEPIADNSFYQSFPFPEQETMEANVIGFIKAIAPSKRSIVFTAHYDAYGIRRTEGLKDSIYNGARDNAVGVAALIELARLFKKNAAPKHNIVFVATAAEEFGLYGSKYYVRHPIFPSEEIILCLNIDGLNVSGPREDYFIFPRQGVDFIDKIQALLLPLGWHYISPDWVDSMNTSFDTASFLAEGIPAVTLWTGDRLKGGKKAQPLAFGAIHSPEDEINDQWNWEGVEEHILLYKTIAKYFLDHPENINVTAPELFSKE